MFFTEHNEIVFDLTDPPSGSTRAVLTLEGGKGDGRTKDKESRERRESYYERGGDMRHEYHNEPQSIERTSGLIISMYILTLQVMNTIVQEFKANKFVFLGVLILIILSWVVSWGIALYQYRRIKTIGIRIDYLLEYHNPNDGPKVLIFFLIFFLIFGLVFNPRKHD